MAGRAIVRRKKYLFHSPDQRTFLVKGFSRFDQGQSPRLPDSGGFSWNSTHPLADRYHGRELDSYTLRKDDLLSFAARGLLRHHYPETTSLGYWTEIRNTVPCLGFRWRLESTRYSSTSTSAQHQLGTAHNGNKGVPLQQIKEASAEECDQAVEGLSSVKEKAKTKKLQASQKDDKSVIRRTWAKLLGIGPALRAVASMSRDDWANKLSHWKEEFKSTMQHYWLGMKLLWADVRISSRLLLKLARGKSLSRRERQQLMRTTADIFRLVPFAVFIIVPFMEFLLPVFLKLFPNMLPSTFQDKMKEQENLKRRLNARIEYAKFLQDTVKEMAKEVKNSRSGEIKKTAEDLDEFMNKVRRGAPVSNEDILGFAKLFNDELTLDNISRPRLVNMCKYMGISPFGTDAYLRYMLRKRLQQ
ncbi:hypothetical protein NMG60_11011811 [Bertholletia excelsa]